MSTPTPLHPDQVSFHQAPASFHVWLPASSIYADAGPDPVTELRLPGVVVHVAESMPPFVTVENTP